MKKFFTKQRIIATAVIAVVLILNIIMGCLPAFGTYKGKRTYTEDSEKATMTVTLSYGNDKITAKAKLKVGEEKYEETDSAEVEYNAKEKAFYSEDRKIVDRKSVFTQVFEAYGLKFTLRSGLAITFQVIFAVAYAVGILFLAVNFDTMKKFFKGKKKVELAENTEVAE